MEIKRYTSNDQIIWDDFVTSSRNGTFLFQRNFMDYHSDKFIDHSLLFFKDSVLISILPANEFDNQLISHQGLTYGEFILSNKTSLEDVFLIFESLLIYAKKNNFNKLIIKPIPYFYHKYPSQELYYVLFKKEAKLYKREVATIIDLTNPLPLAKGRKSQLSKSKKFDYKIDRSYDFKSFMDLENELLKQKYDAKPTHSFEEIHLLASRFPENIQLFTCLLDNSLHAGIVLFISDQTVHCQYIATSDLGRENGALDLLLSFVFTHFKEQRRYFEFGVSTENNGEKLNEGLHFNKESYGARSVVYEGYSIEL